MKLLFTLLLFGLTTETTNLTLFVVGLLAYFVGEFKSRSAGGDSFSIKYWIKDNRYNIAFYVLGTIAYFLLNLDLPPIAYLAAGYIPNTIIDQFQTIAEKKKV